MRQLDNHLSTGGFSALQVVAVDNPLPGFANSRYDITGFNTIYNPAAAHGGVPSHFARLPIIFHTGPQHIDQPLGGVTPEALLMIIGDHLHGLQNSPEACVENQMAMEYVHAALGMLSQRQPNPAFAAQAVQGMLHRSAAMVL